MTTERALSKKQLAFVEHYIATGNGRKSVELAGYSRKTNEGKDQQFNDLMNNPRVAAAIEAERQEIKAESRITLEAKREFLWNLAHECGKVVGEEDIEETVDPDGNGVRIIRVKEKVFKPRDAIAAIQELNAMDGDVAPQGKGDGQGGGFNIEQFVLAIANGR